MLFFDKSFEKIYDSQFDENVSKIQALNPVITSKEIFRNVCEYVLQKKEKNFEESSSLLKAKINLKDFLESYISTYPKIEDIKKGVLTDNIFSIPNFMD